MKQGGCDNSIAQSKPMILKLGGSVITVKAKPLTPDRQAITRLADEINRANVKPLIIIHGGGSFGHPLAKKFEIARGYQNSSQLLGFSQTHQAMVILNTLIMESLIQKNIPAFTLQPSAFIMTRGGRISHFNKALILRVLDMGLTPVLYGDAVLDEERGFSILSGDQLVTSLAASFESERIIICIDVDGLYTNDPKLDSSAKLIRDVSVDELKHLKVKIGQSGAIDVTGGMYGKIAELLPALEGGSAVTMINAQRTDRLYKALRGQKVRGTHIKPRVG